MKKFYLLVTIVSSCIFGMDQDCGVSYLADDWCKSCMVLPHECSDACIEHTRIFIDASLFGIDVNSMLSKVKGACESVRASYSMDTQKAMQELRKIDLHMPEECHNDDHFKKLHLKHWYFGYLMNTLINDYVTQLKQVKGSTIGYLLHGDKRISDLSLQMSYFISGSACKQYMQEMKLDKPLTEISFDVIEKEIHFTSLEGWHANDVCELSMIANGKYIRGSAAFGKKLYWDVKDGNLLERDIVDLSDNQRCCKNGYVATKDYLAILGFNTQLVGIKSAVKSFKEKRDRESFDDLMDAIPKPQHSHILLFVRPTLSTCAAQKAFCNSCGNKKELEALKTSPTVRDLQGFPKSRLLRHIENEIKNIGFTTKTGTK